MSVERCRPKQVYENLIVQPLSLFEQQAHFGKKRRNYWNIYRKDAQNKKGKRVLQIYG